MESITFKPTNKGKVLAGVLLVVIIALGYLGISWYIDARTYITTDNAKVTGDILNASPRIAGKIQSIKVKSGELVKPGEILFTLDSDMIKAQENQAEAALEIAKAQLNKAVGGARTQEIIEAQSVVDQADASFNGTVAGRDSLRSTFSTMENSYASLINQMANYKNPSNGKLDASYAMAKLNAAYSKKSLSDAQFTVQAQAIQQLFSSKLQLESQIAQLRGQIKSLDVAVDVSRAGVVGAQSKFKLVKEGASTKDLEILVSTVRAAEANYNLAKLSLEFVSVRAPSSGTVVQITGHAGDVVTPGLSAMSLIDLTKLTVTAYVLENDLEKIKVGSSVKLSIDSFPGKTFNGTVKEVGEATASVFSIFGSDNASGNFTKVSQRVPVKIGFSYEGSAVIPGMSVTAKIKVAK